MNITKNIETKQPIIDSLLSIPGLLRASDLELKPRRAGTPDGSAHTAKAKGGMVVRRLSANDDLYHDTPQNRIQRIQKLIRTPVASAVLAMALENEALKDCIASRQTSLGRKWAAIIHEATRRAVSGARISEAEADLVRLGVVLASMQQLVNIGNFGEDEDWVYRETKAAREYLMELDPEAGLWLQHALGHGLSDEDLTDKAKQLQSLVRQAGHVVVREGVSV
ncbi:MAG: hypothetical protein ACK4F6_17310 [Hylemonella sp.]